MSSSTTAPDATEREKMLRGELYWAFSADLIAERSRCARARHEFNDRAVHVERIERINLWNQVTGAAPIAADTPEDTLNKYAWIEPPFFCDYGYNVVLGENVFVNFNCSMLDTCKVTVGARTLIGPNVSLFAGTHPVDKEVRNGTQGPELGAPITVGEDCWLGGNVVVLPGVTIGNGVVVGAGSVVTKDVPADTVVAGNPARVVRYLKPKEGETVARKEKPEELLRRLEALETEMVEVKGRLKELV